MLKYAPYMYVCLYIASLCLSFCLFVYILASIRHLAVKAVDVARVVVVVVAAAVTDASSFRPG